MVIDLSRWLDRFQGIDATKAILSLENVLPKAPIEDHDPLTALATSIVSFEKAIEAGSVVFSAGRRSVVLKSSGQSQTFPDWAVAFLSPVVDSNFKFNFKRKEHCHRLFSLARFIGQLLIAQKTVAQ